MNKQEFLYFNMLSLSYPCIFTVLSDIIISNYFFFEIFLSWFNKHKRKITYFNKYKVAILFFFYK